MSEGPEARRVAHRLDHALRGAELLRIETSLKKARAWLESHPGAFDGARFTGVESNGKHLLFWLDRERWIHSHLLMFGSWRVHPADAELEPDPDCRAELVTDRALLRFRRGQVLDFGIGDPYVQLPILARLGPDVLAEPFDRAELRNRLLTPARREQEVGVALLDQTLTNGVGNYLKSEILFCAGLDPWRTIGELDFDELEALIDQTVVVCQRAFKSGGWTVPPDVSSSLRPNERGPRSVGRRHWVFRRTNHPCHVCGTPIRQARQGPAAGRWTYWCPRCQHRAAAPERSPAAAVLAEAAAIAADEPAAPAAIG